ncbi:MAG: metalloregulator ArsR/SmtB family transcription factor [Xenococcaceae cyanobacterium MO_188.B32]|nr:metalloregulator ArsR/SmtB family transcription factor [Xenococcaceae cyanobacterium MO_188.B32]
MSISSPPDSTIIMAGFHALSDPIRIAVIELLTKQELCVCDLCSRLEVSQSKLSFHLKNLKEANLIYPRQEGRWMYYSLNLTQFAYLEQYLAGVQKDTVILPRPNCEE